MRRLSYWQCVPKRGFANKGGNNRLAVLVHEPEVQKSNKYDDVLIRISLCKNLHSLDTLIYHSPRFVVGILQCYRTQSLKARTLVLLEILSNPAA